MSSYSTQLVRTRLRGRSLMNFRQKAAAKKVFYNVAKPGSKYNYQEDLMQFMRGDEALKTILLFEGASESKGISRRALKYWVLVVEEMNIFTTIFLRFDNQKIIYPNSVSNYYCSPDMGDAIDFCRKDCIDEREDHELYRVITGIQLQ